MPAEDEFISMTDLSTLNCLRIHVIGRKIRRYLQTHHADDTRVEDETEERLVRVDRGKGLDNSPLSKLPPELRAKIFEMALVLPTGINLSSL